MTALVERRYETRYPVEVYQVRGFIQPVKEFDDIVSPVGSPVHFYMVDFSADGYRIQVHEPVRKGTRIMVQFQGIGQWNDFLDENADELAKLGHVLREDDDINCLAEVVWAEGMNAAGGFQIGIHLREASLQTKFHSLFSSVVVNALH